MQSQANKKQSAFVLLLRRSWIHFVLGAIVLAQFYWLFKLSHAQPSSDKATWLLLPMTVIYVVLNIYIALAGLKSANAADRATSVMQQTVEEMRLQRNLMYAPTFSFPEGTKCWVKSG